MTIRDTTEHIRCSVLDDGTTILTHKHDIEKYRTRIYCENEQVELSCVVLLGREMPQAMLNHNIMIGRYEGAIEAL